MKFAAPLIKEKEVNEPLQVAAVKDGYKLGELRETVQLCGPNTNVLDCLYL